VFDMFGIEFAQHPDMRRILMPEEWEGYPAAEGLLHHPAGPALGKGKPRDRQRPVITWPQNARPPSRFHGTGPEHGAAAPLHARGAARHPETGRREGDRHRVRDRLPASRRREDRRNRTYQFRPYVDRMDYVAAVSNGLGYCLAVEKLLNARPRRARRPSASSSPS
jgi:hypothetical protein